MKQITKAEFNFLFSDVVSDEMVKQAIIGNLANVKPVNEIGALINAKLTERLFQEDIEIEIVKE